MGCETDLVSSCYGVDACLPSICKPNIKTVLRYHQDHCLPGLPGHDACSKYRPAGVHGDAHAGCRVSVSPGGHDRAHNIADRIESVAADVHIPIDTVRGVAHDGAMRLMAHDRLLMVVTDADARLEQLTPAALATFHLDKIRQAITDYRQARSPVALRRDLSYAAAATLVLLLTIALCLWLACRLDRVLEQHGPTRIHALGIQSWEILRAERIKEALSTALRVVRAIALLLVIVAYLDFVLGRFPATRPFSRHFLDWVTGPLATIGWAIAVEMPNLVFLAILSFVFRFALKLIRLFFDAVGHGTVRLAGFEAEWALPTYKIVRFAVIAFGLIVAYPYIPGAQSAAFKGVSIFVGVLFSLGSSSAIANLIAGYMMTYRRAFRVGDRVQIGEAIGDVTAMRLQVTHLRSLKHEELILPNSQLLNSTVINYSSLARSGGLILHTVVAIGYDTPWRQVEAMLLAAERTPGLLKEPRPFVLQQQLADFAVHYELNVYCDDAQAMLQLYIELHKHVLDMFNEYGVTIMTPAYRADPPTPKLVARQDCYATPATSEPEAGPS